MRPPRMRVALFGRSLAGFTLANAMERAGHEVQMLSDPAELASFEALIIAVGDARLEATVELLEPHVHHGLIVFHTCLSRGVQVLDPLETRGCVVAALAPFAHMRWAVTTLDELGETVVELNITEFRGEAVALSDAERPSFAARAYYAEMLCRLHISAAVDARFFPSAEEKPMVGEDMDTEEIIAAYRGATDPGLRRSYVEVARRLGEVDGREELEMWALQEESR
ncbi:6PGD fold domain-containing protein [Corynebacterium marquesiae]